MLNVYKPKRCGCLTLKVNLIIFQYTVRKRKKDIVASENKFNSHGKTFGNTAVITRLIFNKYKWDRYVLIGLSVFVQIPQGSRSQ
jgi:hypothetical protein